MDIDYSQAAICVTMVIAIHQAYTLLFDVKNVLKKIDIH